MGHKQDFFNTDKGYLKKGSTFIGTTFLLDNWYSWFSKPIRIQVSNWIIIWKNLLFLALGYIINCLVFSKPIGMEQKSETVINAPPFLMYRGTMNAMLFGLSIKRIIRISNHHSTCCVAFIWAPATNATLLLRFRSKL